IEKLVQVMVALWIEPDSVTYGMLIDGFEKVGKLDEALKYFKIMTEVGFKLDIGSCDKLFGHLCNEGKLDEANRIFLGMVDGGKLPNVTTYDILIEVFSREGRIEEIKDYFQKLAERIKLSEELVARIKLQRQNVSSEEKKNIEFGLATYKFQRMDA
ncbi:hypothetical protein KI387_014430, partial [Taxus chinensis]